jgi:hypothetical protein
MIIFSKLFLWKRQRTWKYGLKRDGSVQFKNLRDLKMKVGIFMPKVCFFRKLVIVEIQTPNGPILEENFLNFKMIERLKTCRCLSNLKKLLWVSFLSVLLKYICVELQNCCWKGTVFDWDVWLLQVAAGAVVSNEPEALPFR